MYSNVVIPGIPAKDRVPLSSSSSNACQQSGGLPPPLARSPLLKCPLGQAVGHDDAAIKAYKSGIRSALVRSRDGRWIRLKGCGNREQGFIKQEVSESH